MSEFDLIRTYFTHCGSLRPDVRLGVGDDCALLSVPPGLDLAVSIDTLVAGVHFSPNTDPEDLGHRALAVNLSDLAAMGAEPTWATLALTLAQVDPDWLQAFSRGFSALAQRHRLQLVGGDTTRGPLTITVQVHGLVPSGQALRRSGAGRGDWIYVTGTLGDAGLALRHLAGTPALAVNAGLKRRLDRPTPRVEEGQFLRGVATAAIDVSDGLAADLRHVLTASQVGAELALDRIPMSDFVRKDLEASGDWDRVLAAGDDYELCFTVSPGKQRELEQLGERFACGFHCIGRITEAHGLVCRFPDGGLWQSRRWGYDHFAASRD